MTNHGIQKTLKMAAFRQCCSGNQKSFFHSKDILYEKAMSKKQTRSLVLEQRKLVNKTT